MNLLPLSNVPAYIQILLILSPVSTEKCKCRTEADKAAAFANPNAFTADSLRQREGFNERESNRKPLALAKFAPHKRRTNVNGGMRSTNAGVAFMRSNRPLDSVRQKMLNCVEKSALDVAHCSIKRVLVK